MAEDILIPLAAFAMVAAIFWIIFNSGQKKQDALQETIRKAIDSGTPLTEDLIRALGAPQPRNDLRRGLILLAIGVACVIFGISISLGDRNPLEEMAIGVGLGAFPGLIGLVLIGYHLMSRRGGD